MLQSGKNQMIYVFDFHRTFDVRFFYRHSVVCLISLSCIINWKPCCEQDTSSFLDFIFILDDFIPFGNVFCWKTFYSKLFKYFCFIHCCQSDEIHVFLACLLLLNIFWFDTHASICVCLVKQYYHAIIFYV
jgi:hypothetical protein